MRHLLQIGVCLFCSYAFLFPEPGWTKTQEYNLTSASDYTLATGVQVSGGQATLVQQSGFTDDDNGTEGFPDENFVNCAWDSMNLWVELTNPAANATCNFSSRIFDAASSVSWSGPFSWVPSAPYLKELPDNPSVLNSETANYDADGIDMTGNVLLLHLNETSGTSFADSSASGLTATCTNCPDLNIAGKLSKAPDFKSAQSDRIIIATNSNLLRNISKATLSAWIKADNLTGEKNILGISRDTSIDPTAPAASRAQLRTIDQKIQVGGRAGDSEALQARTSSNNVLTVGQWHHIVGVIEYNTDTITIYVDGSAVTATGTQSFTATQTSNTVSTTSAIGSEDDGASVYFNGQIDEVSVWSRALSAAEVLDLYRRGAQSLQFQIRSCDDSNCDTESFRGPDGTATTYYDELLNVGSGKVLTTTPSVTLSGIASNRYFQYRAFFTAGDVAVSPELQSVTMAQNSYNTSNPTLIANTDLSYDTLAGFTETTGAGHQGSIEYQISNDGGTTWYYFDGSSWQTATTGYPTHTNTATEINNAIELFVPSTSRLFAFRAYLHSDGSQAVVLDTVSVSYNRNPSTTLDHAKTLTVSPGDTIDLSGTCQDADGDTLSGTWTEVGTLNCIGFQRTTETGQGPLSVGSNCTAPNSSSDIILSFRLNCEDANASSLETVSVTVQASTQIDSQNNDGGGAEEGGNNTSTEGGADGGADGDSADSQGFASGGGCGLRRF